MSTPLARGAGPRLLALPPERVAAALDRVAEGMEPAAVLALARDLFGERLALVSSFGAESAPLLHLVAGLDPRLPVLVLETGMLFPETLAYQRDLAAQLGLGDVRMIRPEAAEVAAADREGRLHEADADACCALRKTRPLEAALGPFDAWITGRKRFQAATRAALPVFEADAAGRIKVNPLARWDAARLAAYMAEHGLPPHPLVARGFPSIGCAPCTTPVSPGEDARAGRWRGRGKLECGIHVEDGRVVRTPPRPAGVVAAFG